MSELMPRKFRSPVWTFFERDSEGGTAICKLCSKRLKNTKGSTRGLLTHLIGIHNLKHLDGRHSSSANHNVDPNNAHHQHQHHEEAEGDDSQGDGKPFIWVETNLIEANSNQFIVYYSDHVNQLNLNYSEPINGEGLFTKPNLSLVLRHDLQIESSAFPESFTDPYQVLIHSHSIALSHEDMAQWQKCIGSPEANSTHYLGYQTSGVILAVGSKVAPSLTPGTRVTLETKFPCLQCDYCRSGRSNLCESVQIQGTLRRYLTHPSRFCHPLPDGVSLEEGALVVEVAKAIHTCRRADITIGKRVLVAGATVEGLLVMLVAKVFGAHQVCLLDDQTTRLQVAKQLGADFTHEVVSYPPDQCYDTIHQVKKYFKGNYPEVSVDCHGSDWSRLVTVYATKPGGVVVLIKNKPNVDKDNIRTNNMDRFQMPLSVVIERELHLIGVRDYLDDFPVAIRLLASGRLNVRPLITQKYHVTDGINAFRLALDHPEGVLKVLVQFDH